MLWIDIETFNGVKDIKAGTYEYTRTCEPLLIMYAFDDDPVQLWDVTLNRDEMPDDLRVAFCDTTTEYTAHHAMFDRNVIANNFSLPHSFDPKFWHCTMALALLHGFPGSLEKLGEIFGLGADEAKIKDGKKLINRFSKPAPRNHKADRYTRETHPEEWQRFCEYGIRDVETMRKISKFLPRWNYDHREYYLDQKINDRGFLVDTDLVRAGANAAVVEKETLANRFLELTNGEVEKPTQRAKFLEYLNHTFGLNLENTQSATLIEIIKRDNTPSVAKELAQIAISANKTSTAKYAALEPATSPDNRFRGGLQFSGAARTRRWAGRTFQPQNLPSKGLPKTHQIENYIRALKSNCHDFLYDGELMRYGSAALRGVVIAPENKKLVVSDLSNIEGRANAWLANETWKLKAFADFDNGEGEDLYKVTAGRILGKPPRNISDPERNTFGKVTELALGYQGGVGAIQNFTQPFGIKMFDYWGAITNSVETNCIDKAYENYETWGYESAQDLSQEEWVACETIKLSWRQQNSSIVALWYECEKAAKLAIRNNGQYVNAGSKLRFGCSTFKGHQYLVMRLPSGKFVTYFHPRITDDGSIKYMGLNSITKQWSVQDIYGGKFVENACQSISRDILMEGIFNAEDQDFKTVLTVHDEVISETPDKDHFSAKLLSEILAINTPWGEGLPLAAKGFETYRYEKED